MPRRTALLTVLFATAALLTTGAALPLAGTARADTALPSVYGPNAGPLVFSTLTPRGVQSDPVVHLIFWGPGWTRDTTGIVGAEFALFRELPGTAYNGLLAQYGVHNDVRLAGAFFDSQMPRGLTIWGGRAVAHELERARRLHRWPLSQNAQWIVLPQVAPGITASSFGCGMHDVLTIGRDRFNTVVIPPFQDPQFSQDPCIYDYSADNGQRAPGNLVDATTSITSHEYAEAATDPASDTPWWHGGWVSRVGDGPEIADLCGWYSGTPAGMTVNVTYLWSNALGDPTNGCVIG